MASKIEFVVLNSLNDFVWENDMETLLKSKGIWKCIKVSILDSTDGQETFFIDGQKDEAIGVIITYISWDI